MDCHFKIKTVGAVPGVPRWKSTLKGMLKASWAAAGKCWHGELRPKHFTKSGARKYGYTPRKGESGSGVAFKHTYTPKKRGAKARTIESYTAQKLRKQGHTLPLVFSGELRLKSRMARIVATSEGVKVRLPQAQRANLRHPKSKINMREELTRVSSPEVVQLARVTDKDLDRQIKRLRSAHQKQVC